ARAAVSGGHVSADDAKVDVREHGAKGQTTEHRLYMQLQVFTGCGDAKPLVRVLESSGIEGALYRDVNDPRGIAVLGISQDPAFFVTAVRDLLNGEPFSRSRHAVTKNEIGRAHV